jgi:hypothetical protein
MISLLSKKHMSIESLNDRLDYYFEQIKDAILCVDEKRARRAAEKVTSLSSVSFKKANFRACFKGAIERLGKETFAIPGFADFAVSHLPLYNSPQNYFYTSGYNFNFYAFVEKIMSDPDVYFRFDIDEDPISQIGDLFRDFMHKGEYRSALKLADIIIHDKRIMNADFEITHRLFRPLIANRGIPCVMDFVVRNEAELIRIARNSHPIHFDVCSINTLTIPEILSSSEFGSSDLVSALLASNIRKLESDYDIDFLSKISSTTGPVINEMESIDYCSFRRNISEAEPYNDDFFKFYAHYFIAGGDYLPFSRNISGHGNSDDDSARVYLDKPGMLKGLRGVIETTSPEKEDRIHLLINRLTEMAGNKEMLIALAVEIPGRYLSKHRALGRARIEDDLSL